mgnify:CR=1
MKAIFGLFMLALVNFVLYFTNVLVNNNTYHIHKYVFTFDPDP